MDVLLIAPCGLNCALCHGYQRKRNRCGGCNSDKVKPGYCTRCVIKFCPEKEDDHTRICGTWCAQYPCARLQQLDKRYRTKYGESCLENTALIEKIGLEAFVIQDEEKWRCPSCGELLCCHKPGCLYCGEANPRYTAKLQELVC